MKRSSKQKDYKAAPLAEGYRTLKEIRKSPLDPKPGRTPLVYLERPRSYSLSATELQAAKAQAAKLKNHDTPGS